MIDPARFYRTLSAHGVRFVAGVPDSLLKQVCRYFDAALPRERHVIAVNEGAAIALAAGHHLATGSVPLVYMQNSGLGNALNPLVSLADPEVYALPMVLLIGWRGEPGIADEPQHVKQGRVTPALLDVLGIEYRTLDGDDSDACDAAQWAVDGARSTSRPTALLARKGVFGPAEVSRADQTGARPTIPLKREAAIEHAASALPDDAIVVATTGMVSRELYEYRKRGGQNGSSDFLTVGSMGHASQIALGIAQARPDRRVVCFDGDGAVLMHMGALAAIGASGAANYLHVVFNNGAHDSVGGQPTVARSMDLASVARGCGYREAVSSVTDGVALERHVRALSARPGPVFIEALVALGARPDLGRPLEAPVENKRRFMEGLGDANADG